MGLIIPAMCSSPSGSKGDLAKQMTLRALYRLDDWTTDRLRHHAHEVIAASGEPIDEADAHRADAPNPASVHLDMEFAERGGEAPTPYEVLLNAAMRGDSTSFARQDSVEES